MSKRKFFSLAEKVKIINYAEENPHLSSRKLAEEFGCGRTCIQTLIKQKEDILTDWKCCENSSLKKKERSEEFLDIINVNAETLVSWAERLPEIVKGYELKDIWNADETGLFWHALPDKSLLVKKGRCKGGKYAKQ